MDATNSITQYTLANGLRIVHRQVQSDIAYCGLIIDVGTRDELENEQGMAHYIEHMLFKGTRRRSARQIINRIENIGGELNAYTAKEETVVYAACLTEYYPRTMELLADMTFNSCFPPVETERECTVISDEIESYNDSPSELIYDEYETLLYPGHPLGNAILGTHESIASFTPDALQAFHARHYLPERAVFFSQSAHPFHRVLQYARQYLEPVVGKSSVMHRTAPEALPQPRRITRSKDTHQTHFICGGRAYDIRHPQRSALFLLNNILGGPGMNSRLNLALRERRGLVYNVESNSTAWSDTGFWSIYFGCDPENARQCEELVGKELKCLRDTPVSTAMLQRYKTQIRGQMAIYAQQQDSNVLALGKNLLRRNCVSTWQDTYANIEKVTASQLQDVANELFTKDNINILEYK